MSARDGQSQPSGPESLGGIGDAQASAGSGLSWEVANEINGLGAIVCSLGETLDGTVWVVRSSGLVPDADVPANARLISAAPDLLEAAEAMMEALTRTVSTYNGDTSYDDTGVFDNETALLRAAIAKATR